MNKIERVITLKRLLKSGEIDKIKALNELKEILKDSENGKSINEIDILKNELNNVKRISQKRLKLLESINSDNENSSQIIELLNLSDDKLIKIKNMGYSLI